MDVTASFTTVLLLLAANGLFVAAEFALVKTGDIPIGSLAGGRSATARLTLRIQGDPEAYLASCRTRHHHGVAGQNLFAMCGTEHRRFPVVDGANEACIVRIVHASDVFYVAADNAGNRTTLVLPGS